MTPAQKILKAHGILPVTRRAGGAVRATVARIVGKAQDLAVVAEEIEGERGISAQERRLCRALRVAALLLLDSAEAADAARAASASTVGIDLRRRIIAGL